MTVVSTLVWAAIAALCIWRLDVFGHAWLDRAYTTAPSDPASPVVLPDDLIAWTMQESETWAQEERIGLVREKYALFLDWNRVRTAIGIGVME